MPTLRRNSPRWELFIEFKLAETSDPFRDPKPPKDPLQPQAEIFWLRE